MKLLFLFFIFFIPLLGENIIHEISLSLVKVNLPISDFSKISNPGTGIDLAYRLRLSPIFCLSLNSDYSYFIPKKNENFILEEKYEHSLLNFAINAEYVPLSFKKPFSPYFRISTGFNILKKKFSINEFHPLNPDSIIQSSSGSSSTNKFGFSLQSGFYISLLDFNFSYNNVLTEKKGTQFLSFSIKYRIPINE